MWLLDGLLESFFSEFGISSNLASYLAFAHRGIAAGDDILITQELQEKLEKEYLALKGVMTTMQLYEMIMPKYEPIQKSRDSNYALPCVLDLTK